MIVVVVVVVADWVGWVWGVVSADAIDQPICGCSDAYLRGPRLGIVVGIDRVYSRVGGEVL